MKIVLIGSGVAVPSIRRTAPGLVVEVGGEKLLFDCGPDILHGLLCAGIPHQEIDRIFISHFHPDHTLGLAHFLFASRYELEPRTKDLWIAGPAGLKELLSGFKETYPEWLEARGFHLRLRVLNTGKWTGPGWSVRMAPVAHSPESIAYRLEDKKGTSLVYTGDTGYCDSLVELARGADLLITECSFPDTVVLPSHLTPASAGKIAERAGVGRVLLTHMYPPCDEIDVVGECQKEFRGEVVRAEDGMIMEVENSAPRE